MARLIKLDEIGDYAEERFNLLLRVAVEETDKRLKEGSPTDTGRLKVSWQVSENDASGTGKLPGKYSNQVLPPERTNYQNEKAGNVYTIYNNLPYAEPVIAGRNMPPSWGGTWRSRDNQIEKNYHLKVAKDIQNFIKANANDR